MSIMFSLLCEFIKEKDIFFFFSFSFISKKDNFFLVFFIFINSHLWVAKVINEQKIFVMLEMCMFQPFSALTLN